MTEPAASPNGASIAGFDRGAPGVTPPSSTSRHKVFVTDVIVELGFARQEDIAKAEDAARSSGKAVEQLLLDSGVIDEHQLSLAIAERNSLDHVDLERFPIDMTAAETIGRSVADRCGAVPIAFAADGAIIVAVQDPFDSLAIRRIETATEREVRPAIAAASAIKRLIEQLPEEAHAQPSEPDVPRLRSQRELQLDDSRPAGPTDAVEPPVSEPKPEFDLEPEVAEESRLEEVEKKLDEALEPAEPAADFSDALSMDLGPTTMSTAAPAAPSAGDDGAPAVQADRDEQRRQRELIETKGKVAELERRMEELVAAAEEATNASEKIGALRRAIEENRRLL